MGIVKKIITRYKQTKDPVAYARSIGVTVGEGCRLLSSGWGSEPWLISLGNRVCISGNVTFLTHDGSIWVFRNQPRYRNVLKYGAISIGDNSFIGNGTTILPGVTIGENSVV